MSGSAEDIRRVASIGKEYQRSLASTTHPSLNVKYVLINLLLPVCSHMFINAG
jgi:hypothetical protein